MEKRKHSAGDTDSPRAAKRPRGKLSISQEEDSVLVPSQTNDISTSGSDADHGIIDRIYMKNFMCHSKLEFNFGPNVNFVVGRNGSGKSAIMTALVVGLGGKASVTNRGSSVKNFIKDGKNVAEISIILRNKGTDAFKPEVYGSSIKVERRISSDGSTSYKLKSQKGQVISTKREELSRILDQFNIQVDNPVSILNQDTSRNFLFSKDPRDKYKFFMKATQLEQIESDYAQIQEQKMITEDKIQMKEEGIPDLERDALNKEQRFKDIESLNTLKTKWKHLINVLAWAHVTEVEKELQEIQKCLSQEESRLPKFENKVQESQAKVQKSEEEYNQVKMKVVELTNQMDNLKSQVEGAKCCMEEGKKSLKDVQKNIRSIQQTQDRDRRDKRECEKKIEELRQSAQRDYDKERQEREERIEILTEERKTKEARFSTTNNDFQQFSNTVELARQKNLQLRGKAADIRNVIDQRTRRISELEKSRNNRLRLYGDFIPPLMAEIKKSRNFHQIPKGPIGMYMKLNDIKWALGVECVLKSLVYNFCCHDHHDATILKKLMKQVMHQNARIPGIVISKFEDVKYDISSGMIQGSKYPSFLDVVQVDDPVIYNCLIDQRGVERVLLIANKGEARKYVRFKPPRNCQEAFTLEGDQVYAGMEQRYYSSMQRKARVMQADVANELRETAAELASLREEQRNIDQEIRELQLSKENNEKQRRKLNDKRRVLQNEIGQLQDEIQELESIEDTAPVDVSALEEEVQQLDEQIGRKENEQKECKVLLERVKKDCQVKNTKYQQLHEILIEHADQVDPLKHESHSKSANVERAKHERKHYEGKKKEQHEKILNSKKQLAEKQQKVDGDIEKAREISSERLKTTRSAKSIDSEIQQMSKRIDKEQDRRGDPAEITQQYQRAKEKYEDARKQIKKWKNIIKRLERMLEHRQHAFVQLRHFIALRTKHYFTLMLSQRKYNGKIKFSHKEEALFLEVQPTEGHKQSKSKDMRALSGGERSFATVCFIMALWESMDAPFRALDEFDVFMDMINRKIVMELLLQVAKDHRQRQFMFLTPQDMSKITSSSLVRIVRLNDPERNQSTLPFRRANESQDDELD